MSWAQKPPRTQNLGGYSSWHDVRDYYHKALTATSVNERERNFAEMFRGLGQLMHLIQDASVPEHARDDAHIGGYTYEKWVDGSINLGSVQPLLLNKGIFTRSNSNGPISNFFDTDRYNGSNPEVTADPIIGLAEYANANFYSEDTTNSRAFPFPKVDDRTPIVDRPYQSTTGEPFIRQYFLKNTPGETNGGDGYLLSALGYLYYWRKQLPVPPPETMDLPILDGNVYRDYSSLLIPRAIGYSAGLLEYFFRGKLQVVSVPVFYQNRLLFQRVKIKNITPTQETMSQGRLTLTFRYRPEGGAMDGSEDIFGRAWASANSAEADIGELKYGDEISLDFILFTDEISIQNIDSVRFSLAFQGRLGNEENAVIGKVLGAGEVKFNEEWDKGFVGNHQWAHTGFNIDLDVHNPLLGSVSNTLSNGILRKENIKKWTMSVPIWNESFVGFVDQYGSRYQDLLPIPITRNTYLQFKIDAMSTIPVLKESELRAFQGLWLFFNGNLALQFSQPGNLACCLALITGNYTFPLGVIIVDNLFDLFQQAGIRLPEEGLYLEFISFWQYFFEYPLPKDGSQYMEIDFIRIIEAKDQ